MNEKEKDKLKKNKEERKKNGFECINVVTRIVGGNVIGSFLFFSLISFSNLEK